MGEETEIFEKKQKLNRDLIEMLVRKVFTVLATILTSKGFFDENALTTPMIDTLVGAVLIVISLLWSGKHQTKLKGENVKEN